MTNQEILSLLNYLSNKEQTGNTLSIEEFNSVINAAQYKHFKRKTGVPEQYRIGQPFTQQQPNITEKVANDLRPFNVLMDGNEKNYLIVDKSGFAYIPGDYFYRTGMYYEYFVGTTKHRAKINVVTDDVWNDLTTSQLEYPTYKKPIANFKNGYIRFFPFNIQRAVFSYIRLPQKAIYDYYIKDGVYVYMAEGSTHVLQPDEVGGNGQIIGTITSATKELEWDEVNQLDIIAIILEMIGINLKDQNLQQVANLHKQTGI